MKDIQYFFSQAHGPWWFEGLTSLLGALLGALVALLVVWLQKRTQRKIINEQQHEDIEKKKYFFFQACDFLYAALIEERESIDGLIKQFESRQRGGYNRRGVPHLKTERIRQLSEFSIIEIFTYNIREKKKRDEVSRHIFSLFTILDYVDNLKHVYSSWREEFLKIFPKAKKAIEDSAYNYSWFLREESQKLKPMINRGQPPFDNPHIVEKIVTVYDPLVKIYDNYVAIKGIGIDNIYNNLIKPSLMHLRSLDLKEELYINELFKYLNSGEWGIKSCNVIEDDMAKEHRKILDKIQENISTFHYNMQYLKSLQ